MTSKASAIFSLGRPFTSLLGAVAIFAASFVGAGTSLGNYWIGVALGVAIGYLFTSASNALNDYYDRDIDRVNHPERPLPSGRISPKTALVFSATAFGISIALAIVLAIVAGLVTFGVFLAALAVQVAYDLKVKKIKTIGNLFIGFQTVLAFLFGGVIVNNLGPVAFMASASFLAITAREVVKDVEDIKGDVDKVSLPKLIGVKNANFIALTLISLALALSIIAYYPLGILGVGYFVVVLVADAVFVGSMPLLFRNPNAARKTWKYAMLLALIAFVVGGVA
ncbi:MAG: UbiA family prenyltransferase [Candidatus Bathyarchaeota archaeon]|nr:UbiA family prenyltransferase [Candidatus Bathyarchaeota archaeon]